MGIDITIKHIFGLIQYQVFVINITFSKDIFNKDLELLQNNDFNMLLKTEYT